MSQYFLNIPQATKRLLPFSDTRSSIPLLPPSLTPYTPRATIHLAQTLTIPPAELRTRETVSSLFDDSKSLRNERRRRSLWATTAILLTMSFDWDHSYCLNCDKQTDGTTYCSESCRLAEYEQSSAPSTGPSSPAFSGPNSPWPSSRSSPSAGKFYLSPAYDFTTSHSSQLRGSTAPPHRVLSPSSSHASLCSMKSSSSSNSEAAQLSDAARRELHAYASSFENARASRRQSH